MNCLAMLIITNVYSINSNLNIPITVLHAKINDTTNAITKNAVIKLANTTNRLIFNHL